MRVHRRKQARGFTLIELLIVTGLIGLLTAVVIPTTLAPRAAQRAHPAPERRGVDAIPRLPPLPGLAPVVEDYRVDYQLAHRFDRVGMDVFARTEIKAHGTLRARRAAGQGDALVIQVPVPAGRSDLRDLSLRLLAPGGAPCEPANVVVGHAIEVTLPPEQSAGTIEFAFTVLGRDRLAVWLPAAQRLEAVRVSVKLTGEGAPQLPDEALQPTDRSAGELRWELSRVGAAPPILLELPAAQSPMGKVITLFELTGLAVMLFGLGVWYLAELEKPGLLSRFRLAHFLLLGLNFSLYFAIFAVVSFNDQLPPGMAMVVAGALALPLLVLHVARFTSRRFAMGRMLPLALCSLAVVISGVYLGAARVWVFLAGGVGAAAFVTVTFERWAAARQAFETEQRAAMQKRAEVMLERVTTEADRQLDRIAAADLAAEKLQATAVGAAATPEYQALARVRRPVKELAKQYEPVAAAVRAVPLYTAPPEPALELWEHTVGCFIASAARVLEPLEAAVEAARALEVKRAAPGSRCAACGQPGLAGAFCSHCGVRAANRIECACGEVFVVPMHLLAPTAAGLRCVRCSTDHSLAAGGGVATSAPHGSP